ncbi:MAG: cyclophilin-like fold protein [Nitrososphaerota archaeon]|nr:cyclophilin-like fold protein [Aigarchaeota archaeon]MDW8076219.1 cyclophilin-like fold protein [Nitrososphaerota archaeon]
MVLILIEFKGFGNIKAEFVESLNPKTVTAILKRLPIESTAMRWGDEVYFETPVSVDEENARTIMEVGEIAYWPPGRAIAIFFGPTPVSRHGEPRAYSPCNPIGRLVEGIEVLRNVKNGTPVKVIPLSEGK